MRCYTSAMQAGLWLLCGMGKRCPCQIGGAPSRLQLLVEANQRVQGSARCVGCNRVRCNTQALKLGKGGTLAAGLCKCKAGGQEEACQTGMVLLCA